MQNYETMYILRPDLGEEQVELAIAKYQNILRENGGEQVEIQHRGKRRLAYEIKKQRDGIYIQMNYKAKGSAIEESGLLGIADVHFNVMDLSDF